MDSLPSSVADVDAPTQSTQPTQPIQCTTADTPSTVTQSDLYKHVEELTSMVRSQQETINTLSAKLNFVLSFLSIADDERKETAGGMETADLSIEPLIEPSVSQSQNGSNGSTTTTYASVTASNRLGSGQNSNLREAVVAAVYADQQDKERRSKSIIVTGLNSSNDSNDTASFQRLCMLELGINPVIKFTRRLGHADGNRIRPLLVGLQSADDASRLLGHAKKLRRSTDENVCRNVYINKNLSKLEARLAYEERCRRRQRHQTTRQIPSRSHEDGQPVQPSISATVNTSTSSSTNSLVLNTGATPFHPTMFVSSGDPDPGDVADGDVSAVDGGSS